MAESAKGSQILSLGFIPGLKFFKGTRLEKRVVKGKDRFPLRGAEKIEGGVTGANPRKRMSPPEGGPLGSPWGARWKPSDPSGAAILAPCDPIHRRGFVLS
ncbi:hypothetical protein BU251_08720 [Candidatus Velamenicoccus archaeovorus]|uniref:Uncharacterized protein n=1 Tax=Velamenicoccus archaeovorus TaxID=1930593 RepID=A0A410P6H1_VELA1|nr:hypothetical protein BU251_08720 [Candidatus Velamenicoccus archaeovorus]